ncbi:MAG: hypothetical protein HXK26_07710 [Lancefieldella rimae]|uniref:Uncharacterized protein n=1 Tax=Lancefieldella rimae TaxID=1383 RepID=A0A930YP06_9ACTN|nr:hypothetical protein [Lancefieldella rimae]
MGEICPIRVIKPEKPDSFGDHIALLNNGKVDVTQRPLIGHIDQRASRRIQVTFQPGGDLRALQMGTVDGQRFVVDHIKRPLRQYVECYRLKGATSRILEALAK